MTMIPTINMKRTTFLTFTTLALAGSVFVTSPALGGGIDLYEVSAGDVGLASAGSDAGALDASTLFKNPAGMSVLSGPQANGSFQILYGNVQFTKNNNTSTFNPNLGKENGDNAIGTLPGMSLFLTCPVT